MSYEFAKAKLALVRPDFTTNPPDSGARLDVGPRHHKIHLSHAFDLLFGYYPLTWRATPVSPGPHKVAGERKSPLKRNGMSLSQIKL